MPQKIARERLSSPRGRPRGIRTKTFDLLFGRRVTPLALPIKNTKPRHAPQDRILPLIGRAGEINKAAGERTMIRRRVVTERRPEHQRGLVKATIDLAHRRNASAHTNRHVVEHKADDEN